jgi:hypothetical protein
MRKIIASAIIAALSLTMLTACANPDQPDPIKYGGAYFASQSPSCSPWGIFGLGCGSRNAWVADSKSVDESSLSLRDLALANLAPIVIQGNGYNNGQTVDDNLLKDTYNALSSKTSPSKAQCFRELTMMYDQTNRTIKDGIHALADFLEIIKKYNKQVDEHESPNNIDPHFETDDFMRLYENEDFTKRAIPFGSYTTLIDAAKANVELCLSLDGSDTTPTADPAPSPTPRDPSTLLDNWEMAQRALVATYVPSIMTVHADGTYGYNPDSKILITGAYDYLQFKDGSDASLKCFTDLMTKFRSDHSENEIGYGIYKDAFDHGQQGLSFDGNFDEIMKYVIKNYGAAEMMKYNVAGGSEEESHDIYECTIYDSVH